MPLKKTPVVELFLLFGNLGVTLSIQLDLFPFHRKHHGNSKRVERGLPNIFLAFVLGQHLDKIQLVDSLFRLLWNDKISCFSCACVCLCVFAAFAFAFAFLSV